MYEFKHCGWCQKNVIPPKKSIEINELCLSCIYFCKDGERRDRGWSYCSICSLARQNDECCLSYYPVDEYEAILRLCKSCEYFNAFNPPLYCDKAVQIEKRKQVIAKDLYIPTKFANYTCEEYVVAKNYLRFSKSAHSNSAQKNNVNKVSMEHQTSKIEQLSFF